MSVQSFIGLPSMVLEILEGAPKDPLPGLLQSEKSLDRIGLRNLN